MAEPNTNQSAPPQSEPQTSGNPPAQTAPEIDYDKLAGIVAGKQRITEDTVLKNYFKQQGLSQEQAAQAISSFKEQQKANTPDIAAIQQENETLRAQILQSKLQSAAMQQAGKLNVAPETVPYLLKLADLSTAVNDKGEISQDGIAQALNQVLTDIPALKQQANENRGFVPIGGDGGSGQQSADDVTRSRFGLPPKKK
jgi:hypothetical protein